MDAESETLIPMTGAGFDVALPFDTTQATSAGNYSSPKAGDPCHPLAAGMHAPAIAFGWQNSASQGDSVSEHITPTLDKSKTPAVAVDLYKQRVDGDIAATMSTTGGGPLSGPSVMQAAAVRRLLPSECEALQGFPRNYTAIPWRGRPASECPDGPRYKALGNSWAVPVAAWIGRRINELEAATC